MYVNDIKGLKHIDKVIVHSHECNLYLVSIIVDNTEHYIEGDDGNLFKGRNKVEILNLFDPSRVGQAVLRQASAYDEMVGTTFDKIDNSLEVQLGWSDC